MERRWIARGSGVVQAPLQMPPAHVSSFVLRAALLACLGLTALAAQSAIGGDLPESSQAPAGFASRLDYTLSVRQICAGALLFDHPHSMGTRAGAIAVALDIRASTGRRLTRVTAVRPPPSLRHPVARWLSLQRRLADSYADNWVRIYDAIDTARTPAQHAGLARNLKRLVHAPDPLRRASARLEQQFELPDCTGGTTPPPQAPPRASSRAAPGPGRPAGQ
jgi:hypothetical protein